MNALAKDHLFFKNYFSNSIQTAKGHFAAICGQIPITKGIEFKKSACFEKQCAPGLLKHAGYRSLFFQADPNLDYDGSRNFLLKKAKFDDVPQIVGPRKADGERFYGFGIRDSAFYKRFFSRLKELDATTPHFFTLATVANHLPFTFLAPEENEVYPNPATFKQRYLNSLRLSDKDLAVFFDEFKRSQFFENSIVFATGDHSYPTGEHNSNHNSDFAFQENFGVPLLIVDNRQVLTKKNYSNLQNNHFSHLNLAPTFLDLAGAHHYEEFIAESIFSPTNSQNEPIYLIQPYMGGLQAVIKYPYKIIYEEFTGNKTFYDLSKDPNEMDPLNLKTDSPEYQELTGEIEFIQHRQAAFQCAP